MYKKEEINRFKSVTYKNSNSITDMITEYKTQDNNIIEGDIYKSYCQFNRNETTYIIDNIILTQIDINEIHLLQNSNLFLLVNHITYKKDNIYQIEVISNNGNINIGNYQIYNKNDEIIDTIYIDSYHFYKKKDNWGYILYYIQKRNNESSILNFDTYHYLNHQIIHQLSYNDNHIYNGDIIIVDNIDLNTNRKDIDNIIKHNQYLQKFTTYKENINHFEYYLTNKNSNLDTLSYYGLIQFVYIDENQISNPVFLMNPKLSLIETKNIDTSTTQNDKIKPVYLYIIFFMLGYFTNKYIL